MTNGLIEQARSVADEIVDAADRAVRDAKLYLASPRGRELRRKIASGLTTISPAIAGMPIVRRSPLVRLIGAAGAATVLVKVAEAIRDWEPQP